jgi:hypothetical protein
MAEVARRRATEDARIVVAEVERDAARAAAVRFRAALTWIANNAGVVDADVIEAEARGALAAG